MRRTRLEDHPLLCRALVAFLDRAGETGLLDTEFGRVEVIVSVDARGVPGYELRVAEGWIRGSFHARGPIDWAGCGEDFPAYDLFDWAVGMMLDSLRRIRALTGGIP
jgi:hypothetical protein